MRRSRRVQANLAFQRMQLELTRANLTQEELVERRKEMDKPGQFEKLLIEAARGISEEAAADPTIDTAANATYQYELGGLQGARELPDTGAEIELPDLSRYLDFAKQDGGTIDSPNVLAATYKAVLDVLTGQTCQVNEKEHCKACVDDDTMPQEAKDALYAPEELAQHLASNVHTLKAKFLRAHKAGGPCPFQCQTHLNNGADILDHVFTFKEQSDEHLLAAAKAGLFSPDFDTAEDHISPSMVRFSGGVACREQEPDVTEVPIAALVPPCNLANDGKTVFPRSSVQSPDLGVPNSLPILRLPTHRPITETAWWHAYSGRNEPSVVSQVFEEQRRFMANLIDRRLRAIVLGQSDETGEAHSRAPVGGGKLRKAGIAHLRKRLEDLNFAWATAWEGAGKEDDEEIPMLDA